MPDKKNDLVLRGNIIDPFKGVFKGTVTVGGGLIKEVIKESQSGNGGVPKGEENYEFGECYISPGLIDLHVHGGLGADFVDGTVEAVQAITRFHARGGTTGMLATLVPVEIGALKNCVRILGDMTAVQESKGAKLLGIHLEGPFINPQKKGALNPLFLRSPDMELFCEVCSLAKGFLKIITLAPELDGAELIVKEAVRRDIVVSAGHTEANEAQLRQAVQSGLKNMTHFFNAMAGFHHRNPGSVGALLLDGLNLELIPDGNHVHPLALELAWRIKGPYNVAIITDCIRAGGMPEGIHELGGQQVRLIKGVARLLDGTLAGSTLTMMEAVRYMVQGVGLSLPEAVGSAAFTPARILGLNDKKGSLKRGKDADITVFDDKYQVLMTIVGGRIVYDFKQKYCSG